MSSVIDRSMVAVQVETSRVSVSVPDGLAVATRTYDPNGIPLSLDQGFAVPGDFWVRENINESGFWAMPPRPDRTAKTVDVERKYDDTYEAVNAFDAGPVLVQSRIPIPVSEGMRVNMAGQFRAARTNTSQRASNGSTTNVDIRVGIWGLGTSVDAYGVETDVNVEIIGWQTRLQTGSQGDVLSATIPALAPGIVPAGVDRIVMTVALVGYANGVAEYISCNYKRTSWYWVQGQVPAPISTPKLDAADLQPMRIFVSPPAAAVLTEPNAFSSTGYVFRNRTTFTSVPADAEVVLTAAPGQSGPVVVTVRDGGAVTAAVTVPAGGRVVTPVVCSTGTLTLSAPAVWCVESVRARVFDTESVSQDRNWRYTYTDVTDPVAKIQPALREADLGITTVRFVSDTISAQLAAGNRLRVIGKHAGGHTVVATGTIRGRRIVHDFRHEAQVELSVHDDYSVLGAQTCPVAYDQLQEYGPILNRLGSSIVVDGTDYTGPVGPLPDGWNYFPSYGRDDMSLRDALTMTRNARSAFLFVDRHNAIQLTTSLPNEYALEVSDLPGQGDMSYARDIEFGSDTASIVNTISVTECLLDRKDYLEREPQRGDPPSRFGPIGSRTQSIDYRRESSIRTYGQNRRQFDVVRGTGSWQDLRNDVYGTTFQEWATAILDRYATAREEPARIRLVVDGPDDVAKVAGLQPLDAVLVRHQGSSWGVRIRQLEHTITPDRWYVDLEFAVRPDQAHWLPEPPPIPEPPVDGGRYDHPGPGLYDGGTPDTTGVGVIDGGFP